MRDDPMPCVHATDYEIDQGKHLTWNDSGMCSPCRRYIDRFIARGSENEETPDTTV